MRRKKAIFEKKKVDGIGTIKRIKSVAQNKAQTYPTHVASPRKNKH